MSGADDGFAQFTVDNAAAMKKDIAVEKVKSRRAITAEASGKGKAKSVLPADLPQQATQLAPPPSEAITGKKPVSREQAKRVLSLADNEAIADESQRQLAIKKYRGYWQSPHTRAFCDNTPPNPNWNLPQAKANYERVRDTANAQQSLDLTAHLVEYGLRGLTYVTQDMGVNPRGWILRDRNGVGVADVFKAQKDSPAFQPALSEVGAEAGMAVTANCYSRLGMALFDLCEGFSAAQSQAQAAAAAGQSS
jgi:hypothetical protein